MEELTMLVQLAGGGHDAVRRLRAAGFRRAKDVARAEPEVLCTKIGLSAAVSRRLIRVAEETVGPASGRNTRAPRRGLTAVPTAASSPASTKKEGRSTPTASAEPREKPTPARDEGVSNEETLALTGETRREEGTAHSFWRFG